MKKLFLCFLLIVGVTLITLTGCNLEPHEHSFNTYWTYDETNHWHEANCGHDIVSGTSVHNWDSGQVTEQPTHIQSGTRTFTCEICNATKTEMIPALTDAHTFSEDWSFDEDNHWHAATCEHTTLESEKSEHTWDDGIVTTSETHTTTGVKTYKCMICNKTKTETIPALTEAHTFSEEWSFDDDNHWYAATCGHTTLKSEQSKHTWDNGTITSEPTHTNAGTEVYKCTVCGKVNEETIPAKTNAHTFSKDWSSDNTYHWHAATCGHTTLKSEQSWHRWDNGTVTSEATHFKTGIRTYKCMICNKTKTETISAMTNAHTFEEGWSFDEDNHWHGSSCGHTVVSGTAAHTWDSGQIVEQPTHLQPGAKTLTCTVCDATKTEAIPALTDAHTFSKDWSSDGTYHWHAATCGHPTLKSEQSWHLWDKGTVTTEATHNQIGIRTYKCTVCSKTKTETIPAMTEAHTFSEEWTSDDTYHWHAATCGHQTLKSKESKHTWNNGTILTAVTCTEDGVKLLRCTTCNRTRRESIPATGHIYSERWSADATKHWHNAVCKHDELKEDENAHSFPTYGTAVSQGNGTYKFRYECSTCGYAKTLSDPKPGDIGPAGGIVFYDKGEYSDGWRFLEAAPNDLRVVDDKPTVDSTLPGYKDAPTRYVFGYNRETSNGTNLYVNGSTTYNAENCTKDDIGAGANNTKLLVSAMGTTAYAVSSGITKTSRYAAKLCADLKYNGYDDWFLPSENELQKIVDMYRDTKRGQFNFGYYSSYWSSSEYNGNQAWNSNGGQDNNRGSSIHVLPIRAF